MTLDEAFALVRENDLEWHGLAQTRGEWFVRLKTMKTHSGMAAYGFGQHLTLSEAIRQAILGAKEWENWKPNETLPAPAFGRKPAPANLLGDLTEAQINAAIAALKGDHK